MLLFHRYNILVCAIFMYTYIFIRKSPPPARVSKPSAILALEKGIMSSATPWPCALRAISLSRTLSLRLDQAPRYPWGDGGDGAPPFGRVLLIRHVFVGNIFSRSNHHVGVCFFRSLEVCELILVYVGVRFHAVDRCWYGELCLFHSISYVTHSKRTRIWLEQGKTWDGWGQPIREVSVEYIFLVHKSVSLLFVIVCLNRVFLVVFFSHSFRSQSLKPLVSWYFCLTFSLQEGGYDKKKAIVESCSLLWDPGLVMCRCHKQTYKQEKWQNKKTV